MTCERTVLVVVHTGRAEATETARRVEKVLGDHGIGLRVLTAEAVDRGALHLNPDDMRALGIDIEVVDPDERAAEGCEVVLALGGDGTFLRAAELARNVDIPVLGINLAIVAFKPPSTTACCAVSAWRVSSNSLSRRSTAACASRSLAFNVSSSRVRVSTWGSCRGSVVAVRA